MDIVITLLGIIPVILAVGLILLVIKRNILERGESKPVDIVGVVPAFIILMVATLLVTSMATDLENREYELYDCVPLTTFGNEAVLEGDCIETVTIGGTEYVRMTALGTFTATSGDSVKEYEVTKAQLDLILISGQSNSVGFTSPVYYDGTSPVAPGKAFYLGKEEGSGSRAGLATPATLSTSGIVDMVDSSGNVRVAQMYPSFCSDYVEETGHRVLIVNTGIDGRGIEYWDVGNECDLWMHSVLDYVENLTSEEPIILNPKVMLWSQGHADAWLTEEHYIQHFVPLLERIWGGAYGYSFKNVLSVLPRHESLDNPTTAALAQISVASEYSGFTIASSLPVYFTADQMRDNAHYTQTSYGWLGEAFARSAAKIMGYSPVKESLVMPIEIGAVASLPATASVYGTSGETYSLKSSWTVSPTDASLYNASFSNAPKGTILAPGLALSAYPAIPTFYNYDSSGTTITGLTSAAATATKLVIPTEYNGHTIAAIGAQAFEGNTVATSIETLSDSALSSVGQAAFRNSTALKTVKLPDAVVFGNFPFYGCTSLESFEVPDDTTEIPYRMFYGCSSLASVSIPDSVTTIGAEAFNRCTSLTSVELSSALTSIGDLAFTYTEAVTSVSFETGFNPTLGSNWAYSWTFYDSDGTTELDKTVASNLAGFTFVGSATALVKQS